MGEIRTWFDRDEYIAVLNFCELVLTVHTVRCKGKKGRRDTEREKFLRDKKKDKEKRF